MFGWILVVLVVVATLGQVNLAAETGGDVGKAWAVGLFGYGAGALAIYAVYRLIKWAVRKFER